jgi:hypothetical protein
MGRAGEQFEHLAWPRLPASILGALVVIAVLWAMFYAALDCGTAALFSACYEQDKEHVFARGWRPCRADDFGSRGGLSIAMVGGGVGDQEAGKEHSLLIILENKRHDPQQLTVTVDPLPEMALPPPERVSRRDERRPVAQGTGLAPHHRQIMSAVIDRAFLVEAKAIERLMVFQVHNRQMIRP